MISLARPESYRCITRIYESEKGTRGWEVRVIRRGIAVNEYFADKRFGGKAGALSEAMHFRDEIVAELKPIPRSELARRKTVRNTSGIPGVRRCIKRNTVRGKVFEQEVWEASGTPEPGKRRVKAFSIKKLGEDNAREAAIAQRLRWENLMESNERRRKLPR